MKYKALRPCSFAGKTYLIGEIIPDGVVHESAEARLIKGGVIEAVDVEGVTPPLPSTSEDEPKEEPITEEITGEETEEAEAETEEETEEAIEETEEAEAVGFTVDNLAGLKKSELLELAETYGLDVKKLKTQTKGEIAEAVLEVVKDDV